MHKKSFIAVLAIGLLLFSGTAFAFDESQGDYARVQSSVVKPTSVSATALSGNPAVSIQGGTPRTVPGTFCVGEWQGGVTYLIGGWNYGAEIYAVYQDPAYGDPDVFGPGCTSPAYTFDVTAITQFVYMQVAATIDMQPLTWDADLLSTPGCPIPGGLACAGPAYTFAFPGGGLYSVNMAFPVECCMTGPYFGSNNIITFTGGGVLEVVVDDGVAVPPLACRNYDDWGGGWADLIAYGFGWNNEIYSEGYTPLDVATHCTPGTCDYQWHYPGIAPGSVDDGWNAAFGLPSGQAGGRKELGVRYSAIGLDTLKSVSFLLYGPFTSSPAPDIEVKVYDALGTPSVLCGLPTPGALLYSVVVPAASLSFYPVTTTVTLPDMLFGTLNGGIPEEFFITISATPASELAGLGTAFAAYANGIAGCQPDMHSLAYFPAYDPDGIGDGIGRGPSWVYIGERFDGTAGHSEYVMDAYICAEQVPISPADCAGGAPDQWPTYAHDYQRTSASTINVGDPNQIKLEWTNQLLAVQSFNNPTVAGDVVYVSDDADLNGFDLATGAPIPGSPFTGIPEMGTANRGNTTIDGGFAYVTGGNWNSLTKLPAGDLNKASALWSLNAVNGNSLAGQIRFNACMVMGGVIYILTENISNPGLPGELYAIDAATGALFGGWAINPVILDHPGRHGPSTDGTMLYVGTGDADLTSGSIYSIDPATGAATVIWRDDADPLNEGGYTGGVSIEGSTLYANSARGDGTGQRLSLDLVSLTPNWTADNSRSLYGAPTIGRNFVYIPQDNAAGILMVDKSIGLSVHNFALEGVGRVTQNVTLSCDSYLFAGDRDANFWCLDANTQTDVWNYLGQIPGAGVQNGSALVSHSNGDDYLVTSNRLDLGNAGRVLAYRLNTGSRQRLRQHEFAAEVAVPLGVSGPASTSVADAFENIGDLDLTMTGTSVNDISGLAASVSTAPRSLSMSLSPRARQKLEAQGYTADGEWRLGEYRDMVEPFEAQRLTDRSQSRMAAGAAIVRTSAIALGGAPAPVIIAPGGLVSLDWDYEQSGLGRGIDDEEIIIANDDPDFDYATGLTSSVAVFSIRYQGGCAPAQTSISWNGNSTLVDNDGRLGGQGDGDNVLWGNNPFPPDGGTMYDGGFFLTGDSALTSFTLFGDPTSGSGPSFVGNTAPASGVCGFDEYAGILLGYVHSGGAPGTSTAITGAMVVHSMSDTDFVLGQAIGLDIVATQVGADDPAYGDFKLMHYAFTERNGVALTDVRAGHFIDWDIQNSYSTNLGALWPGTVNGYAIWDENGPGLASGMLDPAQPSLYAGVDPSARPDAGMFCVDHNGRLWTPGDHATCWNYVHNEAPNYVNDGVGDRAVLMASKGVDLAPNGSGEIVQTMFNIDARTGSADEALLEADALDVAARSARWAGYARGNVNDDGFVDLADVLWANLVLSGTPGYINYPDTYSGDVDGNPGFDAADVAYLLNFVSGGPAPQGAWRF